MCSTCVYMHVHACVYMHACLCVCMCVCMHVYTCVHICVCVHALCTCICVYVCVFIHGCVCVYQCVYACMCMHVCVCMFACLVSSSIQVEALGECEWANPGQISTQTIALQSYSSVPHVLSLSCLQPKTWACQLPLASWRSV